MRDSITFDIALAWAHHERRTKRREPSLLDGDIFASIVEGVMKQTRDPPQVAVADAASRCDKGPLISERPQGFVGLVAQLPIAHSADRSTIILSIPAAKHQAKAQRRQVAVPAPFGGERRSRIANRHRNNRSGARIQHQLVGVEAVAVMGRVRSGDAKAIELPRPNPFEPNVPDVTRLVSRRVEDDGAGRRGVLGTVEQVEADAGRVPAEDGEVDAVTSHVSPERKRRAGADGLNLAQLEQTFELVELVGVSRVPGHRQEISTSLPEVRRCL